MFPSKRLSAPPQVIFPPILEIMSVKKMSSVWSHLSPDFTLQLKTPDNKKPNNLVYQLEVMHSAWLRAGSPFRWESKMVHHVDLLCATHHVGLWKENLHCSALILISLCSNSWDRWKCQCLCKVACRRSMTRSEIPGCWFGVSGNTCCVYPAPARE